MTYRLALAIPTLAAILLSSGCGLLEKKDKQEYKYSLTENNCPTGEHSFGSHDELCAGLKNEALNNVCASYLRAQSFKDNGC